MKKVDHSVPVNMEWPKSLKDAAAEAAWKSRLSLAEFVRRAVKEKISGKKVLSK